MVTLEVGIDASGVISGVQSAFTALDRMVNSARIATNALEGIGKTGGAITALGASIGRLHPYLLAATTLMSGLTLAMQMMGGDAKEAAKSVDSLSQSMEKAMRSQQAAGMLGLSQSSYIKQQIDTQLQSLAESLLNKPAPALDVGGRLGLSGDALTLALAGVNNEQATELFVRGKFDTGRFRLSGHQGSKTIPIYSQDVNEIMVSPEQQQALHMQRFREKSGALQRYEQGAFNPQIYSGVGPPAPAGFGGQSGGDKYSGIGPYLPGTAEDAITKASAMRWHEDRSADLDSNRKQELLETSRELEQSAQRVGDYYGDAAARLISGMSSAREIAQGLIFDMMRMGLSEGIKAAYHGFMATPAQRSSP